MAVTLRNAELAGHDLATAGKKNILVVDDSRTVRASLTKMLSNRFNVIAAEDGEDAWRQLQEHSDIHLVITDIMMPHLDGYGLICRIRASDAHSTKNIPIIVVTSAEDDLTRERAHACGANNFILKPFENIDLVERINFHTEANLDANSKSIPSMFLYETEVDHAVFEVPDIDEALELLLNRSTARVDPYVIELALKVIPLLQYCNRKYQMEIDKELSYIKSKLRSV